MEKADEMECSSVILGEQNIVHDGKTFIQDQLKMVDINNDEDQTSKSKEVKWNDDSDCDYRDNSEVENEFSDSSVKPSTKHIKKNQTRSAIMLWLKKMMTEVKVASLKTVISHKYLQLNHKVNLNYNSLSSLNSEEPSSATAIDVSINNTNCKKKKKEGNLVKDKDMAMLVFNPCIMVFSPLFNVIMLSLTILTGKN
jgi:hypothetical protein